ncbi:MAG: hypothetical protein K2R98_21355, partial [Gemmataceae bacterium]|nr:hypothetical protein [Gemmataceae bacterium]
IFKLAFAFHFGLAGFFTPGFLVAKRGGSHAPLAWRLPKLMAFDQAPIPKPCQALGLGHSSLIRHSGFVIRH